jgi:hypothetical protein
MTATSIYQMNVLCSSVHCHFGKAPPQTKFSVWLPCSLRYSIRELKETEEHQHSSRDTPNLVLCPALLWD